VPPVASPPHWVSAFTWCCWSGCSGNGSAEVPRVRTTAPKPTNPPVAHPRQ
jgi:hypothetical protein